MHAPPSISVVKEKIQAQGEAKAACTEGVTGTAGAPGAPASRHALTVSAAGARHFGGTQTPESHVDLGDAALAGVYLAQSAATYAIRTA